MALTASIIDLPGNRRIVKFTVASTGDVNCIDLFGGPARLFWIKCDSASTASNYLKIANSLNPTVASTDPDVEVLVAASTENDGHTDTDFDDLQTDANGGLLFDTGVSAWVVTTAGTAGSTNPTASVIVTMKGIRV